eukprot:131457_1
MVFRKKPCNKVKRWHCVLLSVLVYLIVISFDSSALSLKYYEHEEAIELIDKDNHIHSDSNPYSTSSPIPIYGEEKYCHSDYKYKTAVIMGLYDTGTNVALELLMTNCWGKGTGWGFYQPNYTRFQFNVLMKSTVKHFEKWKYYSDYNYSKHQPAPSHEYFSDIIDKNHSILHDQLNVVLIKDILTWIKSICKQNYYILPIREQWFQNEYCPYNISNYNGTASANEWHTNLYFSFVDLWNNFYRSWMDWDQTLPGAGTDFVKKKWKKFYQYALRRLHHKHRSKVLRNMYSYLLDHDYNNLNNKEKELMHDLQARETNIHAPTVIIRFEDLLFYPDQVVNRLCKCVGGYRRKKTILRYDSNKPHGESRNRTEAIKTYSHPGYRYENYGEMDLNFIKENVNDTIMNMFGYKIGNSTGMLVSHHYNRKQYYSIY